MSVVQDEARVEVAAATVEAERNVAWPLRALYLLLAGLFLVLAIVGVLLPGVPTTPFLLLTSFFLVRSSPRLNDVLLRSRLLGPILRDWKHHRRIKRRTKWRAAALVACMVALTLVFSSLPLEWKLGVLGLASIGIAVILRLPEM
ncbi:MAG: YbaN family protein [Gemmataceae bacterium]|nr:YbaN family protein [Gemmataceae bacterium]